MRLTLRSTAKVLNSEGSLNVLAAVLSGHTTLLKSGTLVWLLETVGAKISICCFGWLFLCVVLIRGINMHYFQFYVPHKGF